MRFLRNTVFLALMLLSPALQAQPADDAHKLASAFLDKIQIDQMMPQLLTASRASALVMLEHYGKTPEQSGEIFDTYMLPEFKERLPELRTKFEDILVADFTVPELQAILSGDQGPARQSAAAKAGQLQGQFAQAGTDWGQDVGRDVYAKNKVALEKLGLDSPPGSAPDAGTPAAPDAGVPK